MTPEPFETESKVKIKCQLCPRVAYNGKGGWLVENSIWTWAGCNTSDALCQRCFQKAVLKKIGRADGNGENLVATLVAAAQAGLIPLANDRACFHYIENIDVKQTPLDVILLVKLRSRKVYCYGLSDGQGMLWTLNQTANQKAKNSNDI